MTETGMEYHSKVFERCTEVMNLVQVEAIDCVLRMYLDCEYCERTIVSAMGSRHTGRHFLKSLL